MPESIVVPEFDGAYDLVTLTPLQEWLLPFLVWWELGLWVLFGVLLIWKGYQYLLAPYFKPE